MTRAMPEATSGENNNATATSAPRGEPAGRDVGVAHVPAIEIQISEQEHQQGRGQDRLARSAPNRSASPTTSRDTLPRNRKSMPI